MARRRGKSLTVLIIDPFQSRSVHRIKHIENTDGIELLGCTATLHQAYNQTEKDQPDVVVVMEQLAAQPEFPMYAAMAEMLQINCVVVCDHAHDKTLSNSCVFFVENSTITLSGGLGRYLLGNFALARTTENRGAAFVRNVTKQPTDRETSTWRTVVIGASTGGIDALLNVLSAYPIDCPPTLIVQHIGGDFVRGFAQRLDRHCSAFVSVATDGEKLCNGRVYVAPGGGHHLEISRRMCRLVPGPPIAGHCPSVDALFQSAVSECPDLVGVLLTGMGRDGAKGLGAIRAAGGWTIAQNKQTSVVYGMPRAAIEMGAALQELPLQEIGAATLHAAKMRQGGRNYAFQ